MEGHRHAKGCATCDGLGAATRGVHVPGHGAPLPPGSWKPPGKPRQEGSGGAQGPPGPSGAVGVPDRGSWETSGNLWDPEKGPGQPRGGWWQHGGTWQARGLLGGAGGITQGTKCLGTGGTAPPDGLWTQTRRDGGQPAPDLSIA